MLRRIESLSLIRQSAAWLAMCLMLAGIALLSTGNLAAQEETEAKRPETEELLPETTVVFVEISNIRELVEKLQESNMGKLLKNESIAPLAGDLYQQATDAFDEFAAENEVGLTMEEIQSIPGGEINIAVIAPKRQTPVFLFTFEVNQESEGLGKVMGLARDAAIADGAEEQTTTVDDIEFHTFVKDGNRVTYFEKDGMIVASNSEEELNAYLDRWMGREIEKIRPLSKNRKFITIMNRCKGTKDIKPDVRFYADPIELARSAFRGNAAAQAGMNFLPILGVDGLLAVGGSSIMFEEEFESVAHLHLLLANPRKGIFDMVALKPGAYRPPAWVPEDTVIYASTSWDIKKMFHEIEKMVDLFQGEGQFEQEVINNINEEMGEAFYEDALDSVTGRITFLQWFNPESNAVNAEVPVLAIELSDDNKWEDIRQRIMDKIQEENDGDVDPLVEKEFKGVRYWTMNEEISERQQQRQRDRVSEDLEDEFGREVNMEFSTPQPAFAVLDNQLVICANPSFLERAIETQRGDYKSLMENEDFKSVSQTITRLAGSDLPAVIMYQQPSAQLRHYYKLVQGDDVRNMLGSFAEENKYAANVQRALDDNPLPPFSEIEQFFRPNGSFVTTDDTGYHWLVFQMRATDDEK